MLAILAGCAIEKRTPYEIETRKAEYADLFILNRQACEAKGGHLVLVQRITTRPTRNGIPPVGTEYYCKR